MDHRRPSAAIRWIPILVALAVFALTAFTPWHDHPPIRRAAAIVLATLVLWISEAASPGVVALLIPVAATFTGLLSWNEAVAAWGDPIVFLFLGAFLLARALEKHAVLHRLLAARWARIHAGTRGLSLVLLVLAVSGSISTVQNNTAVIAMLLPLVLSLARQTRLPALSLLALAYGATFGGMATPVGTAPNFLGYGEIKRLDPSFSFLDWLRVGLPVCVGTSLIGWAVLAVAARLARSREPLDAPDPQSAPRAPHSPPGTDARLATAMPDVLPAPDGPPSLRAHDGPADLRAAAGCATSTAGADLADESPDPPSASHDAPPGARRAQVCSIAAFAATVVLWLSAGLVLSLRPADDPLAQWVRRYLPESLVPLLAATILFMVRIDGDRSVLERSDLKTLDWDTLFLIAGGLCLGTLLGRSGAADALASSVARLQPSPLMLLLALGGVTVLLSELTSNTATAALMVPIASAVAATAGVPPVRAICLVALAASLGFALPVSTPPNALVYGTRLIPLRLMAAVGLTIDVLTLLWVVACVALLG
jgi:sodium-dependent dicarboxylate transporter 2/3/5